MSRQPNFMKFEYNTSIGVAMKTEFWKFYRKGSFCQKTQKFWQIFNDLRLQAAITLQWLQIAGNSLTK